MHARERETTREIEREREREGEREGEREARNLLLERGNLGRVHLRERLRPLLEGLHLSQERSLSQRIYKSLRFRKSTPPQTRQLILTN